MKQNPVKRALAAGKPSFGTWLSMGSVIAARMMARLGFEWLTVDLEHTPTDWETAATMFGVIADAGCVPLARVPANRHDHIKRALDTGAFGIVVPMVCSADEARAAVAAAKYPPVGNRSVGGALHALNFAATAHDYYARADDEVLVVIQTEHVGAIDCADAIYSVPGIDAVFVGPNDLAASMRDPQGRPPAADRFADALRRIRAAAARHRVPCGLHVGTAQEALRHAAEGWQFIAVGSELRLMLAAAQATLGALVPPQSDSDPLRQAPELANY